MEGEVTPFIVLEECHPFLGPVLMFVYHVRGAGHIGAPFAQGVMRGGDVGGGQVEDVGLFPLSGFPQHQASAAKIEEGEA
ncbi:MAG: hypothetical protein EON48_05560 [Acetobacteraceae bacterium]|nr:MAG: hypothetical protein EON48_05560 [Acetobacteraceae bacterium]